MSLSNEANSHFNTSAEKIAQTSVAIGGLPQPDVIAAVLSYEGIPDGDFLQQFAEGIMNGEEVDLHRAIGILRDNTMILIDDFKNQMGIEAVAPLQILVLFNNMVAIVSSREIKNNDDKESFMEATKAVIADMSERMKQTPIMAITIGEVWSFQFRKEWIDRLAGMPKHTINNIRKNMTELIYNSYGSISEIPEDHPAVVKFDAFMFLAQFNSENGHSAVMCIKVIDEEKLDLIEGEDKYNLQKFTCINSKENPDSMKGRLTVDVSSFKPIHFSDENF